MQTYAPTGIGVFSFLIKSRQSRPRAWNHERLQRWWRSYALPRQIAMQEIGREFGGRHHTTVLHSINKIEEMRRLDKALNSTITRLIEACVKPCA